MSLIIKESFANLLNEITHDNNHPYLGMGNPNSKLLLVGSEKALNLENPAYNEIGMHELTLNFAHWKDIYTNYNEVTENHFDPILLNRLHALRGFNPFNPLLFENTLNIVRKAGAGHTYFGLQRLINAYEELNLLNLTQVKSHVLAENTFSRCFITEISASPSLNQNQAKFNLLNFLQGERYNFMVNSGSEFYQDFSTVVIYCGRNNRYVGAPNSENRLAILRIFNAQIEHHDMRTVNIDGALFDVYENGIGAKLILTRHLSSGFGHNQASAIATEM